jgi:tryptophan synthase alpha chain
VSKISDVFKRRKALIAYVAVGYPSLEATLCVVPLLAEWGCDAVELGIPFSDPMADGTTIQQASQIALHNGVNTGTCLEVARALSRKTAVPLLFMSYLNPLHRYGVVRFCRDSAAAGINALIIPDLPPEEGKEYERVSGVEGLDLIYMLAPTSTPQRIRLVAQRARGFIYLVSLTGVTGVRGESLPPLTDYINRVRQETSAPLCVGFGISTPAQAGQVAAMADGVIIGSRLIQLMAAGGDWSDLETFIRQARACLDKSSLLNPVCGR